MLHKIAPLIQSHNGDETPSSVHHHEICQPKALFSLLQISDFPRPYFYRCLVRLRKFSQQIVCVQAESTPKPTPREWFQEGL